MLLAPNCADQRYYASNYGRFNTVDPLGLRSSADPNAPQSWNRYSYALGDPVNGNDPTGEDTQCGPGMAWDGEGYTIAGNGMSGGTPFSLASGQSSTVSVRPTPVVSRDLLPSEPA
jgi:RHS repeat-associated protein